MTHSLKMNTLVLLSLLTRFLDVSELLSEDSFLGWALIVTKVKMDNYIVQSPILSRNTVEPLYSGHPWDKYKCPDYRGVFISGVNLYCKVQFRTFVSVLNTGVS